MLEKLFSPLLHACGWYRRRWRRPEARGTALVLVYHRVAPAGGRAARSEPPGYGVERGVPLDVLEAQLRFMRRHAEPLPLSQLLRREPDAAPAFGVSFDDGYADNLHLAAPLLESLRIPATVFLNTDFVGTDRLFWWERLGEALRASRAESLDVAACAPELRARWSLPERLPLASDAQRESAHWQLSMALMRTPPAEIEAALRALAGAAHAKLPERGRAAPLLDWDQVRELRRRGFELGAHTRSHANLAQLDAAECEAEVLGSVERLAAELDAPVATFAYPYGGPEHQSEAARSAIARSGCEAAFTTELGAVRPGSDPLRLPRMGLTRGWSFACALKTDRALHAAPPGAAIGAGGAAGIGG